MYRPEIVMVGPGIVSADQAKERVEARIVRSEIVCRASFMSLIAIFPRPL